MSTFVLHFSEFYVCTYFTQVNVIYLEIGTSHGQYCTSNTEQAFHFATKFHYIGIHKTYLLIFVLNGTN